jgi:hypothetical protein
MSESMLHFVEYDLQYAVLFLFVSLYALKIRAIVKLAPPREMAPAEGSARRGVVLSFASLFYPWSMESTTRHLWRWVEFSLYHLGALAGISATFTLPFAPSLMTRPVRLTFAAFIAAAAVVGLLRLIRRMTDVHLRAISVPDDYFSLAGIEVFYVAAVVCLVTYTPVSRFVYFIVTALFLVYVPFSKISHYLYWFFARVYVGIRYGRRGVLPGRRPRHV